MTKNDWTNKLRDRLSDYEAASPEGLWADIEQSLPKAKSRPLWMRWTSVAAVVALLMGAGWWLWPQGETSPKALQQPTIAEGKAVHQQKPVLPDAEPEVLTAQAPRPSVPQLHTTSPSKPAPTAEETTEQRQPATTTQQPQPETLPPSHPITSTRPQTGQRPAVSDSKTQRSISIGLHANNGLLAYNHTNGVQMSPQMAQRYDNTAYLPTRSPADRDIIWLAGYEERQHHDHPISLGLTVGYPLTERWNLQTGLVYTRLHSDFESIMRETHISKEQTLHYLGIPLSIQYLFVKGRTWRLYAVAGTQLDWNVRAKQRTEGVDVAMEKDRPQWSVDGALGIEYNPIPQLGLYAEPGLRYYIDNGSKVQNFFKDQPTSWTLQLGIRLNLARQ